MNAITCERREFTRALEIAAGVSDRRSTVPILETVKVSANGKLRFDATDLDISAAVEIGYSGVPLDPFALRGGRQIVQAVKKLGGDTVELLYSAEEGKGPRCRVASGALKASVATLHPDDFPDMPVVVDESFGVDLGAGELAQIARVIPAISTEETRYYLNGIAVDYLGDWLWRFVATDGHRLMMVDVPLPGAEGELPPRAIIPRRFVQHVMQNFGKAKSPVRLSYGPAGFSNQPDSDLAPEKKGAPRMSFGGLLDRGLRLMLVSKLIDGTFPDYTRVVPTMNDRAVRLKRADLLGAVRGLTPLATCKTRAVKITAAVGAVTVSLNAVDLGDGQVRVAAEHGFADGAMIVGLNGQYLVDCLDGFVGEEIELLFAAESASAPVMITDPADTAFRCVLMPMRV